MIRKLVILWLALFPAALVYGDSGDVSVSVTPDTSLLRPLEETAQIVIKISDKHGRPVDALNLSVRLTAPQPRPLVSTDFPMIEGTPLVAMELTDVPGMLAWDYAFPIRGSYRLDVSASDTHGRQWNRTLYIEVHEHPAKIAFLTSFIGVLLVLGFIGGRVFSAPTRVLSMLTVAMLMGLNVSAQDTFETSSTGDDAKGRLTVGSPRVGAMSSINWRTPRHRDGGKHPQEVTLKVVHIENAREIFRMDRIPIVEILDLNFQFTDASPHEVTVLSYPKGKLDPTVTKSIVHVTPTKPSFGIRVRPVLLFMVVVLVGLVTGRVSKRRRTLLHRTP